MRLISTLFLIFASMVILVSFRAESVIWLDRLSGGMKKSVTKVLKVYRNSSDFRLKLATKHGLYIGKRNVEYNDDLYKLYISSVMYASGVQITRSACRAVINETKKVIFGDDYYDALEDYFPSLAKPDARYFVKISTAINSYAILDRHSGKLKEITNYSQGLPKNSVVMKSLKCKGKLFSDEVFFD